MQQKHGKDINFMQLAIFEAHKAEKLGEVPVGSVLVGPDGELISKGHNLKENLPSALGHAELITVHRASKKLGKWRLSDCTLYVTLEPCLMCTGALVQARLGRLVFGAHDPKAGAVESLYQAATDKRLNHQMEITSGVLQQECSEILKSFFKRRRSENKASRK